MDRRAFLLNTLKTAGAAAAMMQLSSVGLLAIPAELPLADGWLWDGSGLSYLTRLNHLVETKLSSRGRVLTPCVMTRDTLDEATQVRAAFDVSRRFKLGEAGKGDAPSREWPSQIVMLGAAACFTKFDPIASIEETASQFADMILQSGARTYVPMELPQAVELALRAGAFRLIHVYDIVRDQMFLVVDTLIISERKS